jgi:hypothetical protein
MGEQPPRKAEPLPATTGPAFSNGIRLSGREWLVLGFFAILLFGFAPLVWKKWEPCTLEPDFRLPHELGGDYWLYQRYVDLATDRCDTLLLGDSVVWGEYATSQETLSHYLNVAAGEERYANLGLDGADPLALTGLVECYARRIAGKNVVLQCNPLWLKDSRTDMQDVDAPISHPRLVPQFYPSIPPYKAEISPRLGTVVEQHLPFSQWANHLQQAYYDKIDIPSWTLEHPYDNPLGPLQRGLPPVEPFPGEAPKPWYEKNEKKIAIQDYPWVDLETSLQWPAFQRVVDLLQRRGNRVFVLVGPFNEHMLTPTSLQRYENLKAEIAAWLEAKHIPHAVPAALPRDQYGDSSHPLAAGYARLAAELSDELKEQ